MAVFGPFFGTVVEQIAPTTESYLVYFPSVPGTFCFFSPHHTAHTHTPRMSLIVLWFSFSFSTMHRYVHAHAHVHLQPTVILRVV